jgi:excisionase family DNA binding protein
MNDQDKTTGQSDAQRDVDEGAHVGFVDKETFEDRAHLEMHQRYHGRTHHHIDLNAEEYSPDELARLLGTSLDVVLHAARSGELHAQRAGHNITCIKHADVVDWLRRRGSGV